MMIPDASSPPVDFHYWLAAVGLAFGILSAMLAGLLSISGALAAYIFKQSVDALREQNRQQESDIDALGGQLRGLENHLPENYVRSKELENHLREQAVERNEMTAWLRRIEEELKALGAEMREQWPRNSRRASR